MYRSIANLALILFLATSASFASEHDSPGAAVSDVPAIRIENVRIVGENLWFARISFELVNRGETELPDVQLDGRAVLQQSLEPLEVQEVDCWGRPHLKERVPAGGWRVTNALVRIPPSLKPGTSIAVDLPLSAIIAYCLWGRYAYYVSLESEGRVWDQDRIEIEAKCALQDCTVRRLEGPAPAPR